MKTKTEIEQRAVTLVSDEVVLRLPCEEVSDSENIETIVEDLLQGLQGFKAYGLSANQIGYRKKICVIENKPLPPLVLVNPVIVRSKGEQKGKEGCVSFSGMLVDKARPREITIHYQNRYHRSQKITLTGFKARKACHEIDHLQGKVILDFIKKGDEVSIVV